MRDEGLATIKIYNSLGQEVATLADKQMFSSGPHEIQFDASGLPSGAYFYKINVFGENAYEHVRKMIVIK
jgi:hypothetical protein